MSYPNKITSKITNVVEVSKEYTGGTTEDVVVNVDNNADIITATITDEAKQKFGKIDKITVNDVEQPISGKTVNIVVPTKEEIGSKLAISIDSNTFVMTVNLLNNQDQVLSTETVDLPLETMVVGASYSNGTLTLVLKNGQTLNVGISSLISGLVPETRTINGKALTDDITLTAEDIGASAPTNMVTTDTEQTIDAKKIIASDKTIVLDTLNNYTYTSKIRFNTPSGERNLIAPYSSGSILIGDINYPTPINMAGNLLSFGNKSLGEPTVKWKDLYLSGNLSDGTNEITVADIVNLKTQVGDIDTLLDSINGESV